MNNETTPEALLKEMWDIVKHFNILAMTTYIGCDQSIYNIWKRRKVLPYRNVKKIVEYLEMHNDDVVTLCWHLMDYYKIEEKKRDEKINARIERNREKSRARYAKTKNQ